MFAVFRVLLDPVWAQNTFPTLGPIRPRLACLGGNGYADIVELMLDKQGNPEIQNLNRRTPTHLASEHGHGDAIRVPSPATLICFSCASELGGESNREIVSFRFVRASLRAVWLRSGIRDQKGPPLFSLFPSGSGSFPFVLPPTPKTSYPTLFGLIGIGIGTDGERS